MAPRRPLLLLLLLSALLPLPRAMNNNYAAAECCARGPSCSRHAAHRSGPCRTGLWMSAQPARCRHYACLYCKQGSRRAHVPVCRMDAISKNCYGGAKPPQSRDRGRRYRKKRGNPGKKKNNRHKKKKGNRKPKRRPPQPPKSVHRPGCAFRGHNGKVVIDVARLKLTGAWERVGNAAVWKRGGGPGIDAAGSGTVCAKVVFPASGKYYLTAISQAPHGTEHNDAWFRFSAGVDLFRPHGGGGSFQSGHTGWYKGYQNDGGMRIANYLLTIDHNGHQFITKHVNGGMPYYVCFSGRSTKYYLYKLVFIKCAGGAACSRFNNDIRKQMVNLGGSKCY